MNFVQDYWGANAATKFKDDEYVLVIETMVNFQYSVPDGSAGSSSSGSTSDGMTLEQANAYITGLSGEVLAEAAKNSGSASALIYASQYEQYLAWFRAGEDIENEDGTVMSTTELGRLLTNLVMNMKDSNYSRNDNEIFQWLRFLCWFHFLRWSSILWYPHPWYLTECIGLQNHLYS